MRVDGAFKSLLYQVTLVGLLSSGHKQANNDPNLLSTLSLILSYLICKKKNFNCPEMTLPSCNNQPVLHLCPLKPNVILGLGQSVFNETKQPRLPLTNLQN